MWSVTGAGKWQHGVGPDTCHKAQAAWQHELSSQAGNVFFPLLLLLLYFQMRNGQGWSTVVMATGAATSQLYLQPVTLSGPWLFQPIPKPQRKQLASPPPSFAAIRSQQQVPWFESVVVMDHLRPDAFPLEETKILQ